MKNKKPNGKLSEDNIITRPVLDNLNYEDVKKEAFERIVQSYGLGVIKLGKQNEPREINISKLKCLCHDAELVYQGIDITASCDLKNKNHEKITVRVECWFGCEYKFVGSEYHVNALGEIVLKV